MHKAIEILSEKIEQLEQENVSLKDQLEKQERCQGWQIWRSIDEKKMSKEFPNYDKLPLPRIEMQIKRYGNSNQTEWIYGLVRREICASSEYEITFLPFHQTTSTKFFSELKLGGDRSVLPYRDSLHIRLDMRSLGLPGFVLFNKCIYTVESLQQVDGEDWYTNIEPMAAKLIRT